MGMRIERADEADIPALCRLLGLLFAQEEEFSGDAALQAEGLRRIIAEPERGVILTLRDGRRIIAMVNLLYTVSTALGGPVALLEDMVVDPGHRGGGGGSRLLSAAIHTARAHGCRRITLLTDGANTDAQRFYRRHGFEPSGMMPMRLQL